MRALGLKKTFMKIMEIAIENIVKLTFLIQRKKLKEFIRAT